DTRRVETPLGTMYVNITEDDKGQPFEVFISLGKAGGALMADVEAIGRLISLALRSGIPLREVYRQLRGISSDRVVGLGPNKVLSVPDAIGIAIEKWMQEKQGIQQDLLGGAVPSAPAPVQGGIPGPEGTAGERGGAGAAPAARPQDGCGWAGPARLCRAAARGTPASASPRVTSWCWTSLGGTCRSTGASSRSGIIPPSAGASCGASRARFSAWGACSP